MKKEQQTEKESYRIRTHLVHGNYESKHWDFDHHLIRPISASTSTSPPFGGFVPQFFLESVARAVNNA